MHDVRPFLEALALVFCVAAVVTLVFQRLRQPVVLGYLLAGIIVGPNVPIPVFVDSAQVESLAQLGVILVMFSIGLELSIKRLVRVLPTAGLTGAVQITAMLWVGYTIGRIFGWDWRESLFLGAMISISSTMIVARVFAEQPVSERLSERVFGVLVVQDLAAILLITVLTAIASGAGLPAAEVAVTAGRLGLFLVGAIVIGLLIIPRLIREAGSQKSNETLLVASIGVCFGLSLVAQHLEYSVALGAFVAGMLVSESGRGHLVEQLVAPLRDVFAAVFFVSIGMLVDPSAVIDNWLVIVVLTPVVIAGQALFASAGSFLGGGGLRPSIQTGMSLAQIGEFSFIIAGVGVDAGVVSTKLYAIGVAVAVVTTFTTPWMVRLAGPFSLAVERRLPKPLQTFACLYGSWLDSLRAAGHDVGQSRLGRLTSMLVIDTAAILGIVVAAAVWGGQMSAWLQAVVHVPEVVATLATGAATIAAVLPFLLGVLRVARRLGMELARRALPDGDLGMDRAAAPRRAFVLTLQLVIVVTVGLLVVAVTQPFLPLFYGAAVLGVLVVVLGIGFWRSTTNLDGHVRAGAEVVLEALDRLRPDHRGTTHADPVLEELLPGLGALTPVRVEAGSQAVEKTLAEVNLRGLTGATVLAILRGGQGVSVPSGKDVIRAEDVLMLTGSQEAIAAALALINEPPPRDGSAAV